MQTTLADILPDILPFLGNKNPQVKEGTLKFLGRCLATSSAPIPPPQVKPTSEALASLLEDSVEGARNEAASCLGTLMKMVGERPLNALMDGIADVRKVKVKEAYEKATVKCKAAGAAPKPPAAKAAPAKKPAPKTAAPAPDEDDVLAPVENKPVKKPPARLSVFQFPLSWWRSFHANIPLFRRRSPLRAQRLGKTGPVHQLVQRLPHLLSRRFWRQR